MENASIKSLPSSKARKRTYKKLSKLMLSAVLMLSIMPASGINIHAASDNLALNKPATVSNQETNYWGADKAVDGIANITETNKPSQSRWGADQLTTQPAWLSVDLEEQKTFQSFVIVWERTNITSYKIQVSDTGAADSWRDVYEKAGTEEITQRSEIIRLDTPATGKYVRLYITGYTAGTINWKSVSLYEFQIYEDEVPASAIPEASLKQTNIALGSLASASESEPGTKFTPDKSVDGIINRDVADKKDQSRWATNQLSNNKEAWLLLDLKSPQVIRSFILDWERTNITAYKIQVSNDKQVFRDVYTKPGADEIGKVSARVELDTAQVARYVRIYVTGYTGGTINWKSVSLYEAQVFSTTLPSEEQSVEDIAAGITTLPAISASDKKLATPSVPEGVTISFVGADYEQIIGADQRIYHPLTTKDVKVNFKITKGNKSAYTKDLVVSVPGLHENSGENTKPSVSPELAEWFGTTGDFTIADSSRIMIDATLPTEYHDMAQEFAKDYKAITGKSIAIVSGETPNAHDFYFTTSTDESLGDEGYLMDIQDYITISSTHQTGAYWSTRSILQVLKQSGTTIAKGVTKDYPKYKVRGFMLDVGRKAFSLDYVKDVAKNMSWYKMNDLQLHLSDNFIWVEDYNAPGKDPFEDAYSGFRLESDYVGPDNGKKLTSTDVFYSKKDFRELIKDSRTIGINIIPEFDTPAHSLAFTKVRPDLAMKDKTISRWADHLDLTGESYAKSLSFIKEIFNEYMEGSDPVFDAETEINVGTDEYSGKYKTEFQQYTADMLKFIKDSGRDVRLWGSLGKSTAVGSSPKIDPENVTMNMWNVGYADPTSMLNEGFKMINMNDGNVYLVPGANYYGDYLNTQSIYNGYNANNIGGTLIPAGSPLMLGADFALWNDYVDHNSNGISEYEVTKRVFPAITSLSARLWGDAKDNNYQEFLSLVNEVNQAPNTNMKYEIPTVKEDVIKFNFNKMNMEDTSGNSYDGTSLKNAEIATFGGKASLNLKGGESFMQLPLTNLAPNFELSFKVNRTSASTNEQTLFESDKGTIKAVQKETGKVGYSRDFYDYSFNYTLPVNEWHTLKIRSEGTTVTLFVDNEEVDQIVGTGKSGRENASQNSYPTLTMPLNRVGSMTHAFEGYIDDIMLTKGSLLDKYKVPQSVMSATANSYNTGDVPENLIDGDANTIWHSYYSAGVQGSKPFSTTLTFDKVYEINKVSYLPRQSGTNGTILSYELYVINEDGSEEKVTNGTWANNTALKFATFDTKAAKAIRLVAISTAGDTPNNFASGAEINVYQPEVEEVDKTNLENLVATSEALVVDDYTNGSFENMLSVKEEAKTILANNQATQDEIAQVEIKLNEAISQLVTIKELKLAIASYETMSQKPYTQESWKNFETALLTAKKVVADKNASQETVDNALSMLNKAVKDLVTVINPEVDKNVLNKLFKFLSEQTKDNYTYASWTKFVQVMSEAKAVLDDENATQARVNEMVQALNEAFANLKENEKPDGETPTNPDTDKGDQNKDDQKNPDTGDTTNIYPWIILLIGAGGIGIFSFKKYLKNKQQN